MTIISKIEIYIVIDSTIFNMSTCNRHVKTEIRDYKEVKKIFDVLYDIYGSLMLLKLEH